MWQPGDAIALRERWGDAIFEARATTVVQDLPQQTMLFVPAGVVCAMPVDDDGVELRMPDRPWHLELRPRGRFRHPVVRVARHAVRHPPAARHRRDRHAAGT